MIRNISKLLVFVGSVNWGLVGVSYFMNNDLNVVQMVVGQWPAVEAIIYILVGLSALYLIIPGKSGS